MLLPSSNQLARNTREMTAKENERPAEDRGMWDEILFINTEICIFGWVCGLHVCVNRFAWKLKGKKVDFIYIFD